MESWRLRSWAVLGWKRCRHGRRRLAMNEVPRQAGATLGSLAPYASGCGGGAGADLRLS
ncbi:hypothetical protein XFF6970_290016 [Xanthomonas citri pv. fuscans]|nr:hypothetical protein XFF6970_290016 [Xanthomonas citri pv. fuscans]